MADKDKQILLTKDELKILDLLRNTTNLFFDLPEHHPQEKYEWSNIVHYLQRMVMSRAAIRKYPEKFVSLFPNKL